MTSISWRSMRGLKPVDWSFCDDVPLVNILYKALDEGGHNLFLCFEATKQYFKAPLEHGWIFAERPQFAYGSASYALPGPAGEIGAPIHVKTIGSWFPAVPDKLEAEASWDRLLRQWRERFNFPLLNTPAATGTALLWQSLPRGEYPMLDPDLARLIRAVSPQHRVEWIGPAETPIEDLYCYDGRFMYAAMTGLDRYPIGAPKLTGGFIPYQPGFYEVRLRVPDRWDKIGLIPVKNDNGGWDWPAEPGRIIETIVAEPELTLAIGEGWEFVGEPSERSWVFDKGRPLAVWGRALTRLRSEFEKTDDNCYAACRNILIHTIGAIHAPGRERAKIVLESDWRQWRRDHAHYFDYHHDWSHEPGVGYHVTEYEPKAGRLDMFMPHWSATLYSLARARVARYALQIPKAQIVKISGDAIYTSAPARWSDEWQDDGRLGRLRRKHG